MSLTEAEKSFISRYVTDTESDVFALTNMPDIVKGALFSRYSRSPNDLRTTLLKEFIQNPESNFHEIVPAVEINNLSIEKAEAFYDRVLVGYGDDSIAELAGAHIAAENISSLAGDILTDARIGISPLEKSARYVKFGAGNLQFYTPPELTLGSKIRLRYRSLMGRLFELYDNAWPDVQQVIENDAPFENYECTPRAYKAAVDAKTCDVLKNILPASRLTNVGMFGNGRAYEGMLTKLISHGTQESADLYDEMLSTLKIVLPMFVKRHKYEPRYHTDYTPQINPDNIARAKSVLHWGTGGRETSVRLIDHQISEYSNNIFNSLVAAAIDYPRYPHETFISKVYEVLGYPGLQQQQIDQFSFHRENRRQKPGRAFELVDFTFEIFASYGAFRDLHRHRMATIIRQPLQASANDITVCRELRQCEKWYEELLKLLKDISELYDDIAGEQGMEIPVAEYCVPRLCNVGWLMKLNARELYWLTELRSGAQGHPEYRAIAQSMWRLANKRNPTIMGKAMVDFNEYPLPRIEVEHKKDDKVLP